MKYIFSSFMMLCVLLSACTKRNQTIDTPLNEMIPADSSGNARYSGNFTNGPYGTVSGSVKLYLQEGKYILSLEGVGISNGPDLHVYLSKEIQPINFIDLGKLKSTSGNQLYEINNAPDFAVYKYALIHCQQFNHLFGSAELR